MRIATFNLENLDVPPKAAMAVAERAGILRPQLERLEADVLCLQEINGQHVPGRRERVLAALDVLLEGTRYESFARAHTTSGDGHGAGDVHNLVTLSRFPIAQVRQIQHDLLAPLGYEPVTAVPAPREPGEVRFDRPLLVVDTTIPDGRVLTVVNVHLRAPLASSVPGQKLAPFVWKSVSGWAEGYYLSGLKRTGQALELRLLIDAVLDAEPGRLIAVVGDFNCEDHETPMQIVVGAEEDTGNGALAERAMVVLDRAVAGDRRFSVLHHGRPQMLDHILASRALYGHFRRLEVHNEALGDEAIGYARVSAPRGSYHAPVVAQFAL